MWDGDEECWNHLFVSFIGCFCGELTKKQAPDCFEFVNPIMHSQVFAKIWMWQMVLINILIKKKTNTIN